MLSLSNLAEITRLKASARLVKEKLNRNENWSKMYVSENKSWTDRLLESSNIINYTVDKLILVALPEFLFQEIVQVSVGKIHKKSMKPHELSDEDMSVLKGFVKSSKECILSNFPSPKNSVKLEKILLCHGLSPVGDSIALLADLGRVFRISQVLNLPIKLMLADISWMKFNRSIKQMCSLSENDIDLGLRICLDKRLRLYKNLKLQIDTKEIAMYPRLNAIDGQELKRLSCKYVKLAKALWGEPVAGKLSPTILKTINKPLTSLKDYQLSDQMNVFLNFPNVMQSLEKTLT